MLIIFAPHVDDAVIGCWSLLQDKSKNVLVLYTEESTAERKQEAKEISKFFGVNHRFVFAQAETMEAIFVRRTLSALTTLVLAPDPHWEKHPAHKKLGTLVQGICKEKRIRFGTYSTDMNVPYLRELEKPDDKKMVLNKFFPSQNSLWEYDHKYFLFEGVSEWNPSV